MTEYGTGGNRRCRIVWLRSGAIVEIMRWCEDPTKHSIGLVRHNIPEGVKYIRSFYDYKRDSFGIVLWHESFPEIPEGELLPSFFGEEMIGVWQGVKIKKATT